MWVPARRRWLPPAGSGQPSELGAIVNFVRRRWLFILICCCSALAVGAVAALLLPARYTATASLIVDSQRPRSGTEPGTPSEDLGYVETQILTMTSELVLLPVVREFRIQEDPEFARRASGAFTSLRSLLPGAPANAPPNAEAQHDMREHAALVMLQRRLRVRRIGTSLVIEISATSADAQKAARIANSIAAVFIEDQRRMSMQITGRAEPRSMARVIGPAMPPLERSGPGTVLILLLSAIAGLVGGVAAAAIRSTLDQRLRTAEDIEAATGLPCLVVVPRVRQPRRSGQGSRKDASGGGPRAAAGHELLGYALDQPSSSFAEALRLLRSLLDEIKRPDRAVVVGISAPQTKAGRTTIAANLAAVAAERGSRTLLIGADHLAPESGPPADEEVDLRVALQPRAKHDGGTGSPVGSGGFVDVARLGSVTMGMTNDRSPSWLSEMMAQQTNAYDLVILDLPVLSLSSETRTLTGPLDALLLVVAAATTDGKDILERFRAVRDAETKQIAVVLNKA